MSKSQLKRFWDYLEDTKYNIPEDLQNEITQAFIFALSSDPATLDQWSDQSHKNSESTPLPDISDFWSGLTPQPQSQSHSPKVAKSSIRDLLTDDYVQLANQDLPLEVVNNISEATQSIDLESKLQTWELNPNGTRRNLRNLIASLHTILWVDSGWKTLSLIQLMDITQIKKAYRQILIIAHPDKLTQNPPEHQVIGARIFDVITTSFKQYQETL